MESNLKDNQSVNGQKDNKVLQNWLQNYVKKSKDSFIQIQAGEGQHFNESYLKQLAIS